MTDRPARVIFVGTSGTVVAIDGGTGETVWQADLKGSDFVTVTVQAGQLFAASKGRVYRLDPATGAIQWCNELPWLGWGIVSIAGAPEVAGARQQITREAEGG